MIHPRFVNNMRLVIQRVKEASVSIDGKLHSAIGKGLMILVGVAQGDTIDDMKWLAAKAAAMRIFNDENGVMNRSVVDVGGEVLAVSQFTLYGDCRRGKRPSFDKAAKPEIANYPFTTLSPHLGVVDLDGGKGFVMADIPGLIEGASDGVGLGHDFLRHIERTKMMVHMVDAAGLEGRDPVEDIYIINNELSKYDEEIAQRPQIIAANKMDACEDRDAVLAKLKAEFEPQGYEVYAISGATRDGVRDLLIHILELLKKYPKKTVVFEPEMTPEFSGLYSNEPFEVTYDEKAKEYVVEGPRIEKMLGYTNLDSEKGFQFFQKFLKDNGILKELEDLGINEGDTVRMYGFSFNYYK